MFMTGAFNLITSPIAPWMTGTLAASEPAREVVYEHPERLAEGSALTALIPLLPAAAALITLLMVFLPARTNRRTGVTARGTRSKLPAFLTLFLLLIAFAVTLVGFLSWNAGDKLPQIVHLLDWITFSYANSDAASGVTTFTANISFYMDGLSWLWMLFVTFLGAMICLYASEYMAGDKGYARFFAAFGLFVTSMACLVMADNLVLLYLGWEGVGLCSYLLIGYFYKKPEAVAAAKKAFIVNRIGDLGLALGLYLTWVTFQTVEYDTLFALVSAGVDGNGNDITGSWQSWAIPLLLMVGAFGKSAQFPLYVWLPDAMEGPTPVSALIHAATMVTAGVYLIARMYPLFLLDPDLHALHAVAWIGTFTALLAATIGMAQFDIKRIMAYSTVSQLGYMFAGLGFLTSYGAAYHVFTHAFFKATLFLACGAVMHGFAGQLDLRKLSGLWTQKGWFIVSFAMLIGCLNLAGFPLTAGYFSKDMILAEGFFTPDSLLSHSSLMAWLLLLTAGLTAYYTFRVFFRVFVGPERYEMGDDHHGDDEEADHAHAEDHAAQDAGDEGHGHGHDHDYGHRHAHHPHPPGWAITTVMVVLAVGSILAAIPYFMPGDKSAHAKGWVGDMLASSSAVYYSGAGDGGGNSPEAHSAAEADPAYTLVPAADAEDTSGLAGGDRLYRTTGTTVESGTVLGFDPHKAMYYISAVFGFVGILVAAVLHGPRGFAGLFLGSRTQAATSRADALLRVRPIATIDRWAQGKWFVDELYHRVIVLPLLIVSHIFHAIDKLLVDGAIVDGLGAVPKAIGKSIRPTQSGVLQGYALSMAAGVGIILLIVWLVSL